MKRGFYPRPNSFQCSPKRRRVDTTLAGSRQARRLSVIDQKLIEGSQRQDYSSSIARQPSPTQELIPFFHEEDAQLDAFDLELLAQEHHPGIYQPPNIDVAHCAQQTIYSAGLEHENAPLRKSRFFDPFHRATPVRNVGSSPSESNSGPFSNPLMVMHQNKEKPWLGRGHLEPQVDSQQFDSNQYSSQPSPSSHPSLNISASGQRSQGNLPFCHILPSVQGIILVSVDELPERYRSMYSFPLFNAIQSKCFHPVYNTNDNIVLSAPTGSGKTVVMELAICRLFNVLKDERFRVVYQAPTKSLCSERFRDWNTKFAALDLKCAELTSDTDHIQLRSIQTCQIIITTPEKWDSMTRKWKDHMRLMQLVKLFLIDEVHILKESRGATLEAVVSRMKNIGSNVRFVALSATVPNSEDIATWLGKDATTQHVPAHREHFGEEFRPVKLQKFVYGYRSTGNDFAFDKVCASHLPEIIGKHSCQKPIMIFCCTRNSSVATAKELARLWTQTNPPARLWNGPGKRIEMNNDDLKATITAGVAFHHAGLGASDRHLVEKGFLEGEINVICCTSTLAIGVNLPCQLVIIKNTVGWQGGGCKEYSDLEMMQMLGRAGRPQFDDSATAVIFTRKERVSHYERLVSGSESLESCLHLNLIDHLNAEIGLGSVTDVQSATRWLAGTFLFVRLRRNPTYYKLKEGASQKDEDELLRQICEKDIKLLRECGLVDAEKLCSTRFGDAMARYYVRFETMKILLSVEAQATLPQIHDLITQAEEFREVRLKVGEKSLYREINKDPGIRYPIKVDIALPSHKISLLLQSELGAIDFPTSDQLQKHRFTFHQEKSLVFAHVNRLIRCVIDCLIIREDSVATRNALELARSFGARVWDHSPLQMKQIEQIGVVAVRKLVTAGIKNLEELEATEAPQIDMILSKNPPFGSKLLARLKEFPKLRESMSGSVRNRFKIELAFMNDKVPSFFQRRPVYVCCLTETSDGRLIDFRRMNASKLQDGMEVTLVAYLREKDQYILCHVMCDDIAGTARQAEIKPDLLRSLFPSNGLEKGSPKTSQRFSPNRSRERNRDSPKSPHRPCAGSDSFDGEDLQVDDFMAVSRRCEMQRKPIGVSKAQPDELDWFSIHNSSSSPQREPEKALSKEKEWTTDMGQQDEDEFEPIHLPNGNWACSHKCKDKTSCKHLCCREGLEKPRRPRRRAASNHKAGNLNQLTLSAVIAKRDNPDNSSKGKQPANQVPKLTAKRNASNLSQSRFPRLPATRKASNQARNRTQSKTVRSASRKVKCKSRDPPKIFSSDFDDDSLNDLPPLSWIMENPGSGLTKVDLAVTEHSPQRGDSIVISPFPDIEPTSTRNQTQELQPLQIPQPHDIIEIPDTSTPESGKHVFTSLDAPESPITTAPFAASSGHVIHPPVRKSGSFCQAYEELFLQRAQQSPSPEYHLPELNTGRTMHQLKTMAAVDQAFVDDEHLPSTDSSSGWDDVDRLLLEEFQDIIHHY
ncbi:uncharacterized protein N7482_000195 [Penicillium canariense]|uniref:DNA 3'-5' helicase n=1 Tax=Penicillium canariense TaxID=189055 RepID=A0A9W9LRT4_9EURO|nr:uncharacterized protein N7482_000195 [Penicillium canariense]KAJ5174318.1 hypothetical protein N7482_000195 [Penicillium canariense]